MKFRPAPTHPVRYVCPTCGFQLIVQVAVTPTPTGIRQTHRNQRHLPHRSAFRLDPTDCSNRIIPLGPLMGALTQEQARYHADSLARLTMRR